MAKVSPYFEAFLDGFLGGGLFTKLRRPGGPTQVFATEDAPCDEEVQQMADTFISENVLADEPGKVRKESYDAW